MSTNLFCNFKLRTAWKDGALFFFKNFFTFPILLTYPEKRL